MRKNYLWRAAAVLCLPLFPGLSSSSAQSDAANQWTWMSGGNSSAGSYYVAPAVYGTRGIPSLDNQPGGRGAASTWTDIHGRLWLFGGTLLTVDSKIYFLNDLWEFDPSTNQWTWQGGSNSPPCSVVQGNTQCAQPGVYGKKGEAGPDNFPGGRYSAASWTDADGNLWLFGGTGFDEAGQAGTLDDLWEFNPATKLWKWVNGDARLPGTGYGNPGVYGTMGIPSAANNPGGLTFANTWQDANGSAWLFGGWGFDVNGSTGLPNNLWKFDSAQGEWTWMGGSSSYGLPWIHPSVYGTTGAFAAGNVPGSRWNGAAWTGSNGHLWTFGGQGFDSQGNSGYLNEVWQFDPARNQWAWMAGPNVMQCAPNSNKQNCGNPPVYGTRGQPAAGNTPGGRTGFASWTGKDGRFWLLGGGYYDLWEFDPSTIEWTWEGGSSDGSAVFPVFGSLRAPSAANFPGSRSGSATWTDPGGNLWLFSGETEGAPFNDSVFSDLWKFQPAGAIQVPGPDFAVAVSGSSLSVQPGTTATASVMVTPSNGFDEPVSLACSGVPAGVSCSFSPATLTPASGAASSTLTLTASSMARGSGTGMPTAALVLSLTLLAGLRRRLRSMAIFLAVSAAGMSVFAGCEGGNSGQGMHQPTTAVITLVGTAGTLQHSGTVTLTVN
jgi:N-acetylneuraminic acid mutarotase